MRPVRTLASAFVAAALLASGAYAQASQDPAPRHSSPEELDQMLAPIALYPDPLLAQILMATTYPLEVTEAAHWLQDKRNASLDRDHLVNALDLTHWEPSVKALVPFGQVLRMMDAHLGWTERLGDAFLVDQAAVLDSVQRLRHQALRAGHLQTTAQESVTTDDQVISLAPPAFGTFYVPLYDPAVAYGKWPNPNLPPDAFPEMMPTKTAGSLPGWLDVALAPSLRDWNRVDWNGHKIYVDPDRFAALNDNRLAAGNSVWQNDPTHRAGLAYADPELRDRLAKAAHSQDADDYEADGNAQIYPAAQKQKPPPGTHSGRDAGAYDGSADAMAEPDDASAAAMMQADPNQNLGTYAGAAAPQISPGAFDAGSPFDNSQSQNRRRDTGPRRENGYSSKSTLERRDHDLGNPFNPARTHQTDTADFARRPAFPNLSHVPPAANHFVQKRNSTRPSHFGRRMSGFAPRLGAAHFANFAGGRGRR